MVVRLKETEGCAKVQLKEEEGVTKAQLTLFPDFSKYSRRGWPSDFHIGG